MDGLWILRVGHTFDGCPLMIQGFCFFLQHFEMYPRDRFVWNFAHELAIKFISRIRIGSAADRWQMEDRFYRFYCPLHIMLIKSSRIGAGEQGRTISKRSFLINSTHITKSAESQLLGNGKKINWLGLLKSCNLFNQIGICGFFRSQFLHIKLQTNETTNQNFANQQRHRIVILSLSQQW